MPLLVLLVSIIFIIVVVTILIGSNIGEGRPPLSPFQARGRGHPPFLQFKGEWRPPFSPLKRRGSPLSLSDFKEEGASPSPSS